MKTKNKLWLIGYGLLIALLVGSLASDNHLAFGVLGFFVAVNFGMLGYLTDYNRYF